MNTNTWTELTGQLPRAAMRGDRDAIRKWLADWSRRKKVEAVVIIDQVAGKVRAGTIWSDRAVSLPKDLEAKTMRRVERLEVWHNHPRTSDAQTNSIPSIEDIIAAMRPGITTVGVVDNYGDQQTIKGGREPINSRKAAEQWLLEAQDTTEMAIRAGGSTATNERVAVYTAEIVLGAAHSVGMVEWKNIDPKTAEWGRRVANATNREMGTPTELAAKMKAEGEGGLGHSGSSGQAEETRIWQTQWWG